MNIRTGFVVAASVCALVLVGCAAPMSAGRAAPSTSVEFNPGSGGRFVAVSHDGFLGHAYYSAELSREMEILHKLADRNPGEPGVWKTKIFILRKIDFKATGKEYKATLSDDDVRSLQRVAQRLQDWVWACSNGNCRMDADVVVIDKTLTRLEGGGDLLHPWVHVISDVIGGHVQKNKLDSVIVFWPAGNIPHKNFWGLTFSAGYRGAGYAWVVRASQKIDEAAYTEVTLHEWLHQVEHVRMRMGYEGLQTLHMAGAMGHRESYKFGVVHRGWMTYYRDFMSVYMTPGMWRRSSVTYNGPLKLEPRFKGGWISEWLVAGAFPNNGVGLDRDFIGETKAAPAEGQLAGKGAVGGKPAAWKKLTIEGVLSFYGRFATSTNAVVYAHVYVYSPVERDAKLWAGSDDGLAVWVNGFRVWRNKAFRGIWPDEDEIPIHLKRGWNRMLLKVDQGTGGWSVMVRLSDFQNGPLNDVRVQAAPPNDRSKIVPADTAPRFVKPPWRPTFFRWRDVRDDPWRLLPELTEKRLRLLTGDSGLRLTAGNGVTTLVPGAARRRKAFLAGETPGGRRVDNALDFRPDKLESLAWLRYERGGTQRDLVLLRADLVDFWLDRLDAVDDPSACVVGRVSAGRRTVIAVDTRLRWRDRDGVPPSELHLARTADANVAVNLVPDRAAGVLGENLQCSVRVRNRGPKPLVINAVSIRSRLGSWQSDSSVRKGRITLAPGKERTFTLAVRLSPKGPGAVRIGLGQRRRPALCRLCGKVIQPKFLALGLS